MENISIAKGLINNMRCSCII